MKFRDSLAEKVRAVIHDRDLLVLVAIFAFGLSSYFIFGTYNLRLVGAGILFGLSAAGFNILYNYTGLLSFGHAMFWGIGAYTVGILTVNFGFSLPASFFIAIAVGAALAAVVGLVSLRHTEIYFALLTLAFGQLIYTVIFKWRGVTGGSDGIFPISRPFTLQNYYLLALCVVFATLIFLIWMLRTPLGLAFRGVRDNRYRSRSLGINVNLVLFTSFVISGVVGSVAGALYAPLVNSIGPGMVHWSTSAELVFVAILGGSVHILGPVLGGIIFEFLRRYIMTYTLYWRFSLGVLLIVLILLFPKGLMGLAEKVLRRG